METDTVMVPATATVMAMEMEMVMEEIVVAMAEVLEATKCLL